MDLHPNLFSCCFTSSPGSERQEPRTSGAIRTGAPQKVLPIETPALSLDELNRLTGNFGTKALIEEGSYGRVFLGKLSNGQQAAIKKLDTSSSPEPDSNFAAQLSIVSRLVNEHFVRLIGYCLEANNRILAYEYATMGSLQDVLHGRKGVQGAEPGLVLTWSQRVKSREEVDSRSSFVGNKNLTSMDTINLHDGEMKNSFCDKEYKEDLLMDQVFKF